jgi:hypothetical protein
VNPLALAISISAICCCCCLAFCLIACIRRRRKKTEDELESWSSSQFDPAAELGNVRIFKKGHRLMATTDSPRLNMNEIYEPPEARLSETSQLNANVRPGITKFSNSA